MSMPHSSVTDASPRTSIAGGVVSTTVIVCVHVASAPDPAVAFQRLRITRSAGQTASSSVSSQVMTVLGSSGA